MGDEEQLMCVMSHEAEGHRADGLSHTFDISVPTLRNQAQV